MNLHNIDQQFKQRFWYSLASLLAVVAGVYIFLQSVTYVLVIVTGLVLATVMTVLIQNLSQKTTVPYLPMYAITWVLVIGLPIGLLYVSAPELGSQLVALKNDVQQLQEPGNELPTWIPARSYIESQVVAFDVRSFFNATTITGQLGSWAFTVGSIVTGAAVLLFVALYVSLNPKLYTRTVLSLVAKDKRTYATKTLAVMATAVSSWMGARLVSMGVVTVLTFIGLLILGVPQALFLALLAGLLSFVPNIGPIVSLLPAALVAVMQSPLLLLYVIILYLIVQVLESYFITPFVQQRMVATPPAILISAQIIFGVLFGIMGVILAAPLFAVLFALQAERNKQS